MGGTDTHNVFVMVDKARKTEVRGGGGGASDSAIALDGLIGPTVSGSL